MNHWHVSMSYPNNNTDIIVVLPNLGQIFYATINIYVSLVAVVVNSSESIEHVICAF